MCSCWDFSKLLSQIPRYAWQHWISSIYNIIYLICVSLKNCGASLNTWLSTLSSWTWLNTKLWSSSLHCYVHQPSMLLGVPCKWPLCGLHCCKSMRAMMSLNSGTQPFSTYHLELSPPVYINKLLFSLCRDCANMILKVHKGARKRNLKVTYEKYMNSDLSSVAAIKPLDSLP